MNYIGTYKTSLLDGLGWRTVLFVAGCDHHCKGCHNKHSWDPTAGKLFDDAAKERLFAAVAKDEVDGLTLSGGDPLFESNRAEITQLCREFKERFPKKNIWLYTGYLFEEVKDLEVMQYVDVVVDGPFILEQRDTTIPFRGSPNQRIINVKTGKELNV